MNVFSSYFLRYSSGEQFAQILPALLISFIDGVLVSPPNGIA